MDKISMAFEQSHVYTLMTTGRRETWTMSL